MPRFRIRNIYKPGSFRVWNIKNVPGDPDYYPVKDPSHGKRLIDALAESQLLDSNIVSNVFGLEIMEPDGEWCEWEDEDGYNISDEDAAIPDPALPLPNPA